MYSFFTVSNLHIILKTELVHLQFYPVISVFRNIKYTCLTLSKLRHILTSTSSGYGSPLRVYYVSEVI